MSASPMLRKRFLKALGAYADRHRLSVHQLSKLVGYSAAMVQYWFDGSTLPRRVTIWNVCQRLDVSFYGLFDESLPADQVFVSHDLAYDSLQARYQQALKDNPLAIFRIVAAAAGSVFGQCLLSALPARMEFDHQYTCRIYLHPDPIRGMYIEIGHAEVSGLCLRLKSQDDEILRGWVRLTDKSVSQTLDALSSQVSSEIYEQSTAPWNAAAGSNRPGEGDGSPS